MNRPFDPTLEKIALAASIALYPFNGDIYTMRLLVDYKDRHGVDHNMDVLDTLLRGTKTAQLIKRIRSELPEGCTLSAITSVDLGRPIYIKQGFLEECIQEQGMPVPDDLYAVLLAHGMKPVQEEDTQ